MQPNTKVLIIFMEKTTFFLGNSQKLFNLEKSFIFLSFLPFQVCNTFCSISMKSKSEVTSSILFCVVGHFYNFFFFNFFLEKGFSSFWPTFVLFESTESRNKAELGCLHSRTNSINLKLFFC
jgi:hypothetical protein